MLQRQAALLLSYIMMTRSPVGALVVQQLPLRASIGIRSTFTKKRGLTTMRVTQEAIDAFRANLKGKVILAPLTKGGNLPYRRLCSDFGAEMTMSEMAYARELLKGVKKERALLRKAPNEEHFSVQIATKQIKEGIAAVKLIEEAGATSVDLNCGCPIYEATRRGVGSALLRKPNKLRRLVQEISDGIDIPMTVKLRSGLDDINLERVVRELQSITSAPDSDSLGVAAITVHPRTQRQGYSKPARWDLIHQLATSEDITIPLIGNGDVLTWFEAKHRMETSGVTALMIGRGALINPWIFQDIKEGRTWCPTADERVAVYRRLACYMKEHFGEDEVGRRHAFYFLPWHLHFLSRWRPLKFKWFKELSLEVPLVQNSRRTAAVLEGVEGPLSLLERLLRLGEDDPHMKIAEILWDSSSDEDAVSQLQALAEARLQEWEAEEGAGRRSAPGEDNEGGEDGSRRGGSSEEGGRGKGRAGGKRGSRHGGWVGGGGGQGHGERSARSINRGRKGREAQQKQKERREKEERDKADSGGGGGEAGASASPAIVAAKRVDWSLGGWTPSPPSSVLTSSPSSAVRARARQTEQPSRVGHTAKRLDWSVGGWVPPSRGT